MHVDDITRSIVDACVKIHLIVGPGCFERVYEEILYFELSKRQLVVERQLMLPIAYDTLRIAGAYPIDLRVEETVIIEVKFVEHICRYTSNKS